MSHFKALVLWTYTFFSGINKQSYQASSKIKKTKKRMVILAKVDFENAWDID